MYIKDVITGINSSIPAFSFSGDKRPARDVSDKKQVPEVPDQPSPADKLSAVETNRERNIQVRTSEQIEKAEQFPQLHKTGRTSTERLINQKVEVKEQAQEAVVQHDEVRQSEQDAELEKAEKQNLIRKEELHKAENEKIEHETARKQFFEDLTRFQLRQEKLSKIFQKQSEIAFIGKHADVTA